MILQVAGNFPATFILKKLPFTDRKFKLRIPTCNPKNNIKHQYYELISSRWNSVMRNRIHLVM